MADNVTPLKKARPRSDSVEIGVTGLHVASGYVYEEFLQDLQGSRGRRVYSQMSENDAIVGAVLSAIDLVIRAVEWRVEGEGPEAEYVDSLMGDMEHSWADFISNAMTMLPYGWSYHEVVLKTRSGDTLDPTRRSMYDDNLMGIRKIAPRSQLSLDKWEMTEHGDILGMWQTPPQGAIGNVFLPLSKCLLFRTTARRNNPEGRSVLRSAYRPWYILKTIQDVEAVGIERELAGLPVVRIPAEYLTSTDSDMVAVRNKYEQIARDLKFNEQGGIVIPSDVWHDADGKPTQKPLVDIQLLSSAGSRTIDTSKVVLRYQHDIARSVLADFIMLGIDSRGSYALSSSKTDLFLRSIETYLNSISAVLNRELVPRMLRVSGFNARPPMPEIVPGRVTPVDLAELGEYLNKLTGAGFKVADEETHDYVRDTAGLPRTEFQEPDPVPVAPPPPGDGATDNEEDEDE